MDFYEADLDPFSDEDFEELVREALDELPDLLQEALRRNVAVVISDGGRRARADGLYHGDGGPRAAGPAPIALYPATPRPALRHDAGPLRDPGASTLPPER